MADPFDPPEHHESGGGGKKTGGLNAKVAGIPVWGLGIGIAALVLVILYLRKRSANAATATASGAAAPDTTAAGLAYDDPNQVDTNTGQTYAQEGYTTPSAVDAYLAGDTSGASAPVGLAPQGAPPPSTDTQWASLASDYLIGQGQDPTLVSNALNAFTSGQTLSTAEQAVVDQALTTFGEPPQGVIPVAVGPIAPVPVPPITTGGPPPIGVPPVEPPPNKTPPPVTKPPTPVAVVPPVEKVKVPNVVGKRFIDADPIIRHAGLVPTHRTATGHVSAQLPIAGAMAVRGSTVKLYV